MVDGISNFQIEETSKNINDQDINDNLWELSPQTIGINLFITRL